MVKLTPEKQTEVDQIFSKIYAGLPPEAKAKIDQIKAEGAQEIRDLESEFEARIKQLEAGGCRLIPIAELVWGAAFAARRAEPLESRKDLASYESGRAFIRAIKAALLDGSLVAREQGSGIPISDRAWCLENDTLLSLPKMMPHDRLMVRTDEVRAWLEKMGIAIDALPLVQLAQEGITSIPRAPTKAKPEELAGEQAEIDRKETGPARTLKPEESPEERGERLRKRVEEKKAAGVKAYLKEVAEEEKVSISTLKQIVTKARKRRDKQ
ncbi:hypothetical protein GCM10007933_22080 [Zoogloea oryzae]|uniref:Uncharacterized protein n=1 Tax=Zoogloea oryzae TaxID=310767 RepID=A0ABQ6FAX7_9RHOO|nr:hypothetical protein [Zoogloea oryzae]GLT22748.1 hypothetical protein GCM10007933_22080 [Zoogloea oryzae]